MRNRAETGRRLALAVLGLAGAAAPAQAQMLGMPVQQPSISAGAGGGMVVNAAQQAQRAFGGGDAQGQPGDPAQRGDPKTLAPKGPPLRMVFQPRVTFETDLYTTNGDSPLKGPGEVRVRAGAGFSFRSNTAGLRGTADYMIYRSRYKEAQGSNRFEQALSANLTAELVERLVYLDAVGNISATSASLFGLQPTGAGQAPYNSSESQNFLLRPRLQTRVADWLDVNANLIANLLRSDGGYVATDVLTTGGGLQVGHRGPVFGMTVDASTERHDFRTGRDTRSDRVWATVTALIEPLDLQLRALAGTERSDMIALPMTTHATWGIGARWRPSARTNVDAVYEQRAFGRAHALTADHTSGLVNVRLSSTRGIQLGQMQAFQAPQQTAFDLYMGQAAQVETDPLKRVSMVLDLLNRFGIDPLSLQRANPFVSNSTVLATRDQLSVALRGQRTLVTGSVWRATAERLDKVPDFYGDFALTNHLRTTGFGLQVAHRVTPLDSVALNYMLQQSVGVGTSVRYLQQSLTGSLTSVLTTQSTGTLMVSRIWSDRQPTIWGDTAVTAKYDLRF